MEDIIYQYFTVARKSGPEAELKPNGLDIRVTNANKMEWIRLTCRFKAYDLIK
jgi:hypothetical protein